MNTSKPLPKIMYDQTQFSPLYVFDKEGVCLDDRAYFLMKEISGYTPETWYMYTQNKPESFWFGAYDIEALKKEAEIGFKNWSDSSFVEMFENRLDSFYKELVLIRNEYFENFYKKEYEVLGKRSDYFHDFLKKMAELSNQMYGYYMLTQPQRFDKFQEKFSDTNVDISLVLNYGRHFTFIAQIRKIIVGVAMEVSTFSGSVTDNLKEDKKLNSKINGMIEEVGFLNWSALGGEKIDYPYVEKEITKLLENPNDLRKENEDLKELERNIEKRNRLVLDNSGDKAFILADITGHAPVLRINLQMLQLCLMKYVFNFIDTVQKKFNLSKDEINTYTFPEILSLISNGEKVSPLILAKRQKGFLRIMKESGTETYIGEEAHEQIAELLAYRKKEIQITKELKGTVASWPDKNKEIITGSCVVMTTNFDADLSGEFKNFKEGDILIVTQTHPHIVPIMKKAEAIITDEGGVTCHAAIISRELRKPCIIGTRLATKIFKTGDTIKINLSNGTVKKT